MQGPTKHVVLAFTSTAPMSTDLAICHARWLHGPPCKPRPTLSSATPARIASLLHSRTGPCGSEPNSLVRCTVYLFPRPLPNSLPVVLGAFPGRPPLPPPFPPPTFHPPFPRPPPGRHRQAILSLRRLRPVHSVVGGKSPECAAIASREARDRRARVVALEERGRST